MSDPSQEVIRWKLKCGDESEFLREYAPKLSGVFFVAMPVPLSRGTQFPFQVKFTDGVVRIRGTALVVSSAVEPRPGVLARFVSLEPDSIRFPFSAQPPEPVAPVAELLRPSTSGRFPSLAKRAVPEARPTPPSTASLELLAASPIAPAPEPLPPPPVLPPPVMLPRPALLSSPPLASAPAPAPAPVSARPAARKPLDRWGAAAVVLAVVVMLTAAGLFATESSAEQALVERLGRYEQSVRDGRLTGPGGDTALDHLVAARGQAPDDERVRQKVAELAKLFSMLADKAIARGDFAEAAVHLEAVVLVDPSDAEARRKLTDAEARVARP